MGAFRVSLDVGDPEGVRYESVEVLVDTGASYTTLSTSMLGRLGVEPRTRASFVLADGRQVERDVGQTWVRLEGMEYIVPVVFGEEDAQALLGVVTLEIFRLAVDPVSQRLMPVPGLLMLSQAHCRAGRC